MTTRQAWCVRCDDVAICDERGCIACARKQDQARRPRRNRPLPLAAFCAICIDGTAELRAVQLEPGGPVHTVCKRCDEREAAAWASGAPRRSLGRRGTSGRQPRQRYRPLDETSADIVFRILQRIRHFDWATAPQLADAIGLTDWERRHKRFEVALSRSARAGLLERAGRPLRYEYRITELGLARLEHELRRGVAA